MGVKSTTVLTRAEAEARYVKARLNAKHAKYERKAKKLTDIELENALEEFEDARSMAEYGVTGTENFVVEG